MIHKYAERPRPGFYGNAVGIEQIQILQFMSNFSLKISFREVFINMLNL